MSQASLFDVPDTRGASRASDPATSRAAGRSMEGHPLRAQQALVLGAVAYRCTATAFEVFGVLERDTPYRVKENVISKRLGELRDLGMVRVTDRTRPGSSHRHQQVYEVTDAGRQALA